MEKRSINISGIEFNWDLDKGVFNYEGQPAVLFWITSAMKSFFETIEEISGEDASNLVFETSGYRQGKVVGDYFEKIKHITTEEAVNLITKLYASAGWGIMVAENLDFESKKVTVTMKDTWEHRINVAQGKKKNGNFLPAHFAGIFSGLFSENIWFTIKQHQIENGESTVVEYYPSTITVTENIHQLARKKESEHILQLEAQVEKKTKELRNLVTQLSSPIIPVLNEIVVVPLLGSYDSERAEELITKTLNNLPTYKATYLLLDLTGLDQNINTHTVSLIEKVGSAASLIGTETILVGISPELGMTISTTGIDFSRFPSFQTLQHGITYALEQQGRSIK